MVSQFVRIASSPTLSIHLSPVEAEISACVNSPPSTLVLSNDSDVLLTSPLGMLTLSVNPPHTVLPAPLRLPLDLSGPEKRWRVGAAAMLLGCDYDHPVAQVSRAVDLARRVVDALSKGGVAVPKGGQGGFKDAGVEVKNEWEGAGVGRKRGVGRCGYVLKMVGGFESVVEMVGWLVFVKEGADKRRGKKRKRKGKGGKDREDTERVWNKEWGERVVKAAAFYDEIYQGVEGGVWDGGRKGLAKGADFFRLVHGLGDG
ncbi:hypothetical protein TrRE_jg12882, partial [Triparma retinervis]